MFVESLHIYRRMTDIRDVNHGPMRFYYIVGYGWLAVILMLCLRIVGERKAHNPFAELL